MRAREITQRGVLRLLLAGRRFHPGADRQDDRGATLVEYVLMMSLVVLVCIAALTFFGTATSEKLEVPADCFNALC